MKIPVILIGTTPTPARLYNDTAYKSPIFRFLNKICVRLHHNPPRADAENTMNVPAKWKAVSVATHEDNSSGDESNTRRKRKAKST